MYKDHLIFKSLLALTSPSPPLATPHTLSSCKNVPPAPKVTNSSTLLLTMPPLSSCLPDVSSPLSAPPMGQGKQVQPKKRALDHRPLSRIIQPTAHLASPVSPCQGSEQHSVLFVLQKPTASSLRAFARVVSLARRAPHPTPTWPFPTHFSNLSSNPSLKQPPAVTPDKVHYSACCHALSFIQYLPRFCGTAGLLPVSPAVGEPTRPAPMSALLCSVSPAPGRTSHAESNQYVNKGTIQNIKLKNNFKE